MNVNTAICLFEAHADLSWHCSCMLKAEKLRAKAQRPETSRSNQQLCRYLYYLGRIRAIQLEYTDAKECLQQAARKVSLCPPG